MPSIRNIAVALPAKDGHILVQTGYDSVKGQHFYRALGGGIEFGELAADAVRREFQEELGVELDDVELLDVVENIFDYEGATGHEIVHVFAVGSAALANMTLGGTRSILDEPDSTALWVSVDSLRRGEVPLFPAGLLKHLAG
ncbi:NUDIX hydrolase [Nesterenkonia muleiensis]|uniref:NUDIX hydrolase n=1 Tax=Nesterenkonia muleiensis TaxID=2282648 RepID=UPI000E75F8AA|nr:NUDIX domain-containing protein [Nesterenkonia muleiensis]